MGNVLTLVACGLFALGEAASADTLPSNVGLRSAGGGNSYLDSVDFNYQIEKPSLFAHLKVCVAQTITNNAVALTDAAGSSVGAFTGTYYRREQQQTVQGAGVFKVVDDSLSTLIATGTSDAGKPDWGLSPEVVRYDMRATAAPDGSVTVKFLNITRAQQNTGMFANDGFKPVGTWSGAGAPRIYEALKSVSEKVRSCIGAS